MGWTSFLPGKGVRKPCAHPCFLLYFYCGFFRRSCVFERLVGLMRKFLTILVSCVLLVTLCGAAAAEQMTISMVGDCTIGEQWCYRGYKSGYVYKITQAGLDYPFSNVAELFAADDLTIANCECALTTKRPADQNKIMSLYGPPEFAEIFRLGNVDVCNLANNHGLDFGPQGRLDTIDALNAVGIASFGDDYLYETEIKGVKIGIVGRTYPVSDYLLRQMEGQIQQLRDDGCTFVIASIHWGREGDYNLGAQQKENGRKLIDIGADMVYGHGPHVLQPIEYYKGKLIFYSLANFTFGANSNPADADTTVIQLTFDIHDDGTMTPAVLTALPFRMHNKKDYRPWMLEDEASQKRVWGKLWRNTIPKSNLPASFKSTGVVYFTEEAAAQAGAPLDSVAVQ